MKALKELKTFDKKELLKEKEKKKQIGYEVYLLTAAL